VVVRRARRPRRQRPGHRHARRLADLDLARPARARHHRPAHPSRGGPALAEWTDTEHAVLADLGYERAALTTPIKKTVAEIARLGRTLKQRHEALLASFDTGRSSNGGTEAVNGLIELHRRIARGFRNRDDTTCACC
jgi:transposase